ncbi:hypothetical protein PY365_16010 [Roseiarcaceae bacterium H3SJ34-1]|uniref:hypothetical protein n=1 Tax=Terripilifer ovatus TaxID=3032367 RepID=UPI003AB9B8B3|nr:hypothetical protein [Roseiarcaceae bacterium H3SJ34-1]
MDRRLFLRSLVAVAGVAALVPMVSGALAAPRDEEALRQGLVDQVNPDAPADEAAEAQYYYRRPFRRRRFWRRRMWRRRMWGRPVWRRRRWRRRVWRRRMWRRGYW